eukprot:290162_1
MLSHFLVLTSMGSCSTTLPNENIQNNKKPATILQCNGIRSCDYFNLMNLLKQTLEQFQFIKTNFGKHQTIKNSKLLDYFLHLINKHDTDDEFEYISKMFSQCNVKQCQSINRIYRNRNCHQPKYSARNKYYSSDIIDRMHCYYYHSYVMAYKLTKK